MILKVTIPDQTLADGEEPVAILNDRTGKTVHVVFVTAPLRARLRGRNQGWFFAEEKSGAVEILDEAPETARW